MFALLPHELSRFVNFELWASFHPSEIVVVLISKVTSCTHPRLLNRNKYSTREGGWVGMVGIWWCWDGRGPSRGAEVIEQRCVVTVEGRVCWTGCARGIWGFGAVMWWWFLLHMLAAGQAAQVWAILGPMWHWPYFAEQLPAIPCPAVIRYGNHRVAGLNGLSVHLSSCSFAAGLSSARWACLEFPQVVLVPHSVEGRCWKASCRLPEHWESEGREVNAR